MTEALQQFLDWINAHPNWALALLLAASALDAIFIIGAFVPASIVLFAVGALVALGSLELWEAVLAAAVGAVIGDGISFWLGRRYGESLFANRWLRRYPEAVANSRRFFERYGVQGVMLARFLGPVRALTPALAGAAGQRAWVFLTADGVAAVAWALAYIMPGVVFGASLGLAAEVAGRLATVLVVLVVVLWLVIWLVKLLVRRLQPRTEAWIGHMLDWSRRHRRLGKFGAALTDSQQPETPALALLAALLLTLSGIWLYLVAGPGLHPYPSAIDATTLQTLRDLHTPWGLSIAQALLQFGEWTVYGPVALVTFVTLVVLRKRRAAAHWLAALGFGAVLSLGLYAIPTLAPPYRFFDLARPHGFSARDLILASATYAFLPVLLSTGQPPWMRMLFYGSSAVVLILVALAQVYLGAQWFTTAVFMLAVATIWATLLGLGYRRHGPEMLPARRIVLPVGAVFVLALSVQLQTLHMEQPQPAPAYTTITATAWHHELWHALPMQRQDVSGRPKQPMQLQWAGSLAEIDSELRAAGWLDPAELSAGSALRWLSSGTDIAQLPVLPQVHASQHPALMLRLPLDDQQQYLIRLWPSGYRLDDGRPLWVGTVSAQGARSFYRLLRYPVTEPRSPPLAEVLDDLPTMRHAARGKVWLLWSAHPRR